MVNFPEQVKKFTLECHDDLPSLLLDLLDEDGIEIESSCGGNGTCGKCRVQILEGDCLSAGDDELELVSLQEINKGIRLACCCQVMGKVTFLLPKQEKRIRILENSFSIDVEIEPQVKKQVVSLCHNCFQHSRLDQLLKEVQLPVDRKHLLDILKFLGEYEAGLLTVVINETTICGLETSDTTSHKYGVAIDIGTTTVVASLLNLINGHKLAVASSLNPQTRYGMDVLSRIQHTSNDSSGTETLCRLIVQCSNELIGELCTKAGINRRFIYEVAVAANTVMLHLLLGVNPNQLGRSPYYPIFNQGQVVDAETSGLSISPFARLYCLPSVSSYIGADIVSGIIAADLDKSESTILFLDIGTNGEIVLLKDAKLLACSTAAGPAFEGMNISCGMQAQDGAIEKVCLHNKHLEYSTIGGASPCGLCGSGLVDLVSTLLNTGIITPSGRINTRERILINDPEAVLTENIGEVDGKRRFWVIPPSDECINGIYISQADIRQVQLAKSAIVSGIKTLISQAGITADEIDKTILAGAFGTYVDTQSLIHLGFFPPAWKDRILLAGNSALAGAELVLLSKNSRLRVEDISQKIEHFELSLLSDFEHRFIENMSFPCQETIDDYV